MVLETETSYLPLIRSPLLRPGEEHEDDRTSENGKAENGDSSSDEDTKTRRKNDPETPSFRRFESATNIELFYDLFFVANLAAFTYIHEVNDSDTLKQYVGFFCIIWFTWYQVSLYDVRFAMDSAFERTCKAIQFMVMIGFAIVGPRFNPGEETSADDEDSGPHLTYFRALTLILCVSRFILVIEYLQALWFARNYKKVVVAMSLLAGVYFAASMVYLGLYWSFNLDANGENHSYIAWYIVAVVETIFATMVSIFWRDLSFVGTHLVERMSLLTLIILGEGAIAIAKAVQYITTSDGVFTLLGPVPAMIVCAVLNLYFMYMIYFDWIHEGLFGTVRQQIWSVLHFPLHVALVLAVEGASQSITWNAGVQAATNLVNRVEYWSDILFPGPTGGITNVTLWNEAADELYEIGINLLDVQVAESSSYESTITGLANIIQFNDTAIPAFRNGSVDPHTAGNALWWMTGTLYSTIFKIGGFYSPSSAAETNETLNLISESIDFTDPGTNYTQKAWDTINKTGRVYRLTYVYFFITTGCFVLLCTLLVALNRGRKTQLFWSRLAVTAVIGLGLALLSLIATSYEALVRFVESDWVLPTITLCLFAIVVLNSVKLAVPKKMKGKGRK